MDPPTDPPTNPSPNPNQKVKVKINPFKSCCNYCRKMRIRCSGELPCNRCVVASEPCSYPKFRRRRKKVASTAPAAAAAAPGDERTGLDRADGDVSRLDERRKLEMEERSGLEISGAGSPCGAECG